jgi:8-oxo-dGTP diphosphatase
MKAYVLGFAFDDVGRVVLMRKNRPEWQKGRWNGVGGLIEGGETPQVAMAREFKEETGVDVHPAHWTKIGSMVGNSGWFVHVYTAKGVAVRDCHTCTDEGVSHFVPWKLPEGMIPNLPAMISIAQIAEGDERPEFVFTYR